VVAPVLLIPAVALAISYFAGGTGFFGICPYPRDSRAYAQHGCVTSYIAGATTLNAALSHYDVPMPTSASEVRFYLDPGAFNGGDAFYLKFSATPTQIQTFMHALGVQRASNRAAALWQQQVQSHPDPVPWAFDDTFSAFTYTKTIGEGDDAQSITGTVIVPIGMTAVYVFIDG